METGTIDYGARLAIAREKAISQIADTKPGGTFKRMKEGWFLGVITKAEIKTCNSGTKDLALTVAPLDADRCKVGGISAQFRLHIPILTDDNDIPKNVDFGYPLACLLNEKFTRFAKKAGDGKNYVLPDGSLVTYVEAKKWNTEVKLCICEQAEAWQNDPSVFLDEVVYAKVENRTMENGKIFQEARYVQGNPPSGAEIRTEDFVA